MMIHFFKTGHKPKLRFLHHLVLALVVLIGVNAVSTNYAEARWRGHGYGHSYYGGGYGYRHHGYRHHRSGRGGAVAAGVIGGLALGALIGSATAAPAYGYYDRSYGYSPAYYGGYQRPVYYRAGYYERPVYYARPAYYGRPVYYGHRRAYYPRRHHVRSCYTERRRVWVNPYRAIVRKVRVCR